MNDVAVQAVSVGASHGFGSERRQALVGVDAVFRVGRWCAVVGPNGAGKSTLLKVLAGLLPHTGQVLLQGRPLAAWDARARARQLAWLGQAQGEAPGTAADDLRAADLVLLGRLPHRGWLAAPGPDDMASVQAAMAATHCWGWRDRRFGALSGGERQRVLMARALAVQAPVLLLDEPLAHLDPPHQADWVALVRSLARQGTAVVSVLHEPNVALQADELLLLAAGRLRHHGPADAPATHRALEALFDQRLAVLPLGPRWVALAQ